MGFVYDFEYFNHRMLKRMIVESNPEESVCDTKDSKDDSYYHNECLSWQHQKLDYCANIYLQFWNADDLNITYDQWYHDQHLLSQKYQFCYEFQGDELDGSKHDHFKFDGAKRELPRKRDYIASAREVRDTCADKCRKKLGMFSFKSRYGGWFDRIDGFHHFDDICTDVMNCDWQRCGDHCMRVAPGKSLPVETVYAQGTFRPHVDGE